MDDNFQKSFLDINSATDDCLVGRVPGWITELISRNSVELFRFLASIIVACKPTNKEHGYRDTAIKFADDASCWSVKHEVLEAKQWNF